MTQREKYIHKRLMELACIAENRELDEVERQEEERLENELELLTSGKAE